jgi:hypothetical protein
VARLGAAPVVTGDGDMAVGWSNTRKLCREILDQDPKVRSLAADSISDWLGSYSVREAKIIAGLLVALAASETVAECRESQLHALTELAEAGLLDPSDVAGIEDLESDGKSSEFEYLEYLREFHASR